MNCLLIGATGFIGTYVIEQVLDLGHNVIVFHRGSTKLRSGAKEILGDRNDLEAHTNVLRGAQADVVIDFVLSNERQAGELVRVFQGFADRIVALSSGDVYRACGILHGFESGPLQPLPLTEDSELRTKHNVYGAEDLTRLRSVFSWIGDEYDKIPVEATIMNAGDLRGTVLRLPMVYGPGDPLHRLFPYLKRMDDHRPAILLQDDVARWCGPRGYVENVAAAITLAATTQSAAGRIYNVAESEALSEMDWVRAIADEVHWQGQILERPAASLPAHLRLAYRSEQHWVVSSTRIRSELRFQEPVDFRTGIARTVAWERANPPQYIPDQFDYSAEDDALAVSG